MRPQAIESSSRTGGRRLQERKIRYSSKARSRIVRYCLSGWRATESEQARAKTFVALKFLSSAATKKTHEGESEEMEIVDRMIERQGQQDSPWLRHFGRCLERFDHRTQDDVRQACIVMEPLAWDLYVLEQVTPARGFSLRTCKSIVRQILVGLDGLHQEMNTVYAGTLQSFEAHRAVPLLIVIKCAHF